MTAFGEKGSKHAAYISILIRTALSAAVII